MILVSGSLAYDRIMDFPGYFRDHLLPEKLHQISVSFLIDRLVEHFGGTAGNIAYNLALLGEKPVIFASAGSDYNAYRKWQMAHGIDVSNVRIASKERTAAAYIMTDKADNQITAFHPGAMREKCKMQNAKIKMTMQNAKLAIVSPGNIDDMRRLPMLYKKYRVPYLYDPGQAIPALSARDLTIGMTGARALIVNDYELALIQKKTGLTKKQMLSRTEILVTTLGEKGSTIECQMSNVKCQMFRIPVAKPKKVVDPTGAGDAYRAGFIHGLLRGWPLERVGRFAALVSVYTVEKVGTQTHEFTWKNIRKRYQKNFSARL